jgi:hypothetical protein
MNVSVRLLSSYQPVDDPLIRSNDESARGTYSELFRPSQPHPTVQSARHVKYLIVASSKFIVFR